MEARASRILGADGLRRYADEPISRFSDRARLPTNITYLALSGGGADGAYGVGVLNGWTAAGKRPLFSVVSGVSTGALIAPFAFLGPGYDDVLREVYTSGVAATLLDDSNFLRVAFGSGLAGNTRLRALIGHYVDSEVLKAISREHAKGRKLLIATTDLDTQRTVIWDMGRIASIGSPEALKLFQDVMTASASIPLVFPPMMIDAEADGRRFQEMHVDGGVTAPILTLPDEVLLQRHALPGRPRLSIYLLINNKIENEFSLVSDSALEVASRSIASVTKSQTRSIIFSTYQFAKKSGYAFELSYIDQDYPSAKSSEFDTEYMRKLYDYGYAKALAGRAWVGTPPSEDGIGTAVR